MIYDVLVVGGGQSGLAVGYYLRRKGWSYKILDQNAQSGGSWQHYWQSLRLFSPAQWSSLPGIIMEGGPDYYPSVQETISYLQQYEERYKLPIERPVEVQSVERNTDGIFELRTSKGQMKSKALVSATGSFANPFFPEVPGRSSYGGEILHSSDYRNPEPFEGKRVVVVGEGNSGAQILADLSQRAETFWITTKAPSFLPDEVDGRVLFDQASEIYKAKQEGRNYRPPSLGDIVMVPPVKEAKERNVYQWHPPIKSFSPSGVILENEKEITADVVIFCTGYSPTLEHLKPLKIIENGKVKTSGTKAREIEGLWLVGYGSWTGFASATLIGVGRTARDTVKEIEVYLQK